MGTLRLAHRGDWQRAPENTVAALLAALAVPGCDGVEFDVRVASDGVPVLLHDETLARVQGRPELVATLPSATLADLGVPALEEVLRAVPRGAFLDVELKGAHDRAVVDILVAGRGADLARAVVSSFEPETLEGVGGLAPRWPRWLNADDLEPATIATAVELGCRGVSVEWHAIDGPAMRRARTADLQVAAWTVRRRPTFRRLAALGVVAICVEAAALDG